MAKSGNWHVVLDDGTGNEWRTDIVGGTPLAVGDLIPGILYERVWLIDRVDEETMGAHAVPDS